MATYEITVCPPNNASARGIPVTVEASDVDKAKRRALFLATGDGSSRHLAIVQRVIDVAGK